MSIQRHVEWVRVAEKWTKMSVMGLDVSSENLRVENRGETREDRVVILMIPGNPGNEAFYSHFGRRVIENLLQSNRGTWQNCLFYTVSSLNHVKLPPDLEDENHKSSDLFSLDEQVAHKLSFVKEHLPRGKEVYIFGHSIGSYMMLRILPEVVKLGFNVKRAVALFPTIQHMAISPNGRRLQTTLATLSNHDWLAKCLTFWVDYLPDSIKKWLVGLNLSNPKTPSEIVEAAVELVHMDVFRNIVHMSNDELDQVVELDSELLKLDNICHFYYGLTDGWCPLEHGNAMLERLGEHHVTLDPDNCEHAFVIADGEVMARNVIKYFE